MDIAVVLISIALISMLFTVRFKLNAAAAPLVTLCSVTLFLIFAGMAGLLRYAVWVVFAFALFCPVYLFVIKKESLKKAAAELFRPGMVFFLASSAMFAVMFAIRQPAFRLWDEFSFWGPAAKITVTSRQLYTLVESSIISTSYQPFLAVLSFFVQSLSPVYSEWKVYLAYDMLIMACMSLIFANIRWKNVAAIIAAAAFSLFGLYAFRYSFEGNLLYFTSYSDIPLGVLFGGALLMHFHCDMDGFPKFLATAAAVASLPFLKDMGLALGMIAAGVIFVDMALSGERPTNRVFKKESRVLSMVYPLMLFALVLVCHEAWNLHFSATAGISRAIEPYEYSLIEILSGKDEFFNELVKEMTGMLFGVTDFSVFDSMGMSALLLTAAPVAASLLSWDRKKIVRAAVFSVLMCCGFLVYYYFHAYCYTAVTTHFNRLLSYKRYMSTYFLGWMSAAVGFIFSHCELKVKYIGLVAGTLVSVAIVGQNLKMPANNSYMFTGSELNTSMDPVRYEINRLTASFRGLDSGDRLYFVCQDSEGGEAFMFNYEMMPAYTVEMIGGGNFVRPGSEHSGMYDVEVDRDDFLEYLNEQRVELVFVLKTDEYFIEEFAPAFSDGMMGRLDNSVFMYYVSHSGGGTTLVPVGSTEGLNRLRASEG